MVSALHNQVNTALDRFEEKRSEARRFHADSIGADVDPSHCLADFLACVRKAGGPKLAEAQAADSRLRMVYKTALSDTAGGTVGGYLVPVELRDSMMRDVAEAAIFRPHALTVPMTTETLSLPLPDAITVPASAGTSPFFGGISMSWGIISTSTGATETEPKFRQVDLHACNLSGQLVASNPVLADMGDGIEAWLRRLFGSAVAWHEDYAFLQGNGLAQPAGLLNAPCTAKVNRTSASAFLAADASNMIGNLLPSSFSRACWVMSPTVVPQLTQFSGWIPNGPLVLHGLPVIVSEKLPALGTLGDVMLIDPSLYVIGDRQRLEIGASEHVKFTNYQTVWFLLERIDGRPWLSSTVTLQDTSTVVAQAVALN